MGSIAFSACRERLLIFLFLIGFLASIPSRCLASGATAAPVFPLASAVYKTQESIAINDSTAGATIYYTMDGSTPTTHSARYTGPISLSTPQSLSFEAVAIAPGNTQSPVTKIWYQIDLSTAAPSLSVPAGAYRTPQSVTLADATPGAVIYYTTNGKYPTTSSSVYTGVVTISSDSTLQAMASAPTYMLGPVASASYTIAAPAPSISPAPGTYTSVQTVTLSSPRPGALNARRRSISLVFREGTAEWRASEEQTIAFTNGCFDILHSCPIACSTSAAT